MIQLYHDVASAGISYRPTLLLRLVNSDEGLATAKRYLQALDVTGGFKRLWTAGRLDLTIVPCVLYHYRVNCLDHAFYECYRIVGLCGSQGPQHADLSVGWIRIRFVDYFVPAVND